MAVRGLGRAWGNALGGWRAQPRGPMGKFMRKGAGAASKSNYRPSRNQIAQQSQQQAITRRAKTEKNKKIAKNVAIVGGVALAAGGAYYGIKRAGAAQTNLYDTRQGAKFIRNAAKYNRSTGPGASVAQATRITAGSIPTVRLSPRQPIGLRGFSNASMVSHNIQRLLPPVSHHTNTRRPAMYRHTGEALRNVQKTDMGGKELIPKRDMTRELRSMNMRKTNWKKKATNAAAAAKAAKAAKPAKAAPTKQEKKAAVQNPTKAATPASKPAAKAKSAPKSKNVQAPTPAVTVKQAAPSQPAVGAGSKKTKSSPAKQAATGGNKPKSREADVALPQDYYENNPAPLGDDDDVRIVGGKIQGVDQFGEEVIIPIAGRRSTNLRTRKPTGSRPGEALPRAKASNQPAPQETVQRKAKVASGNLDNTGASTVIISAAALIKPGVVDHNAAWYAKRFDMGEIQRVASDATMDKLKIKDAMKKIGASKADAELFAKAVGDFRKAGKRARGRTLDGKKVSVSEAKASSLAGDMVVKTKSESQRITEMNDKMANGKMAKYSPGEIREATDLLKALNGLHGLTASQLWEESQVKDGTYTAQERRAMVKLSNYKNLLKLHQRK